MKTVLDVLKAMEKASAREIAARMKIEPATVLGMLREHEERNEVIQVNGYWKVATGEVKSQPMAASSVSKAPASVSVSDVIALLAEHGPQTSLELATLAGIESKRVAPMLTHHITKGRILREKVGSKFVYSVVASGTEKAITSEPEKISEPTATILPTETPTVEIVADIPIFTARANDLILPTASAISSRLRKARAEVASLEKLQLDVRAMRRRYGKILKELAQ